ncbi:hypothetical protein Bbelb_200450 [Branchiostoma belcheri]|nr:hypothetical protein Bbelb_200450 [Branchiostoma belcheri]
MTTCGRREASCREISDSFKKKRRTCREMCGSCRQRNSSCREEEDVDSRAPVGPHSYLREMEVWTMTEIKEAERIFDQFRSLVQDQDGTTYTDPAAEEERRLERDRLAEVLKMSGAFEANFDRKVPTWSMHYVVPAIHQPIPGSDVEVPSDSKFLPSNL